jgi:hypothetical protein
MSTKWSDADRAGGVGQFPSELAPASTQSNDFLERVFGAMLIPMIFYSSFIYQSKLQGTNLASCHKTWTTRAILPPPHDAHGLHTHRGLVRTRLSLTN